MILLSCWNRNGHFNKILTVAPLKSMKNAAFTGFAVKLEGAVTETETEKRVSNTPLYCS